MFIHPLAMLWSQLVAHYMYVFCFPTITILLSNCNVMVKKFGALFIFLNEYHIILFFVIKAGGMVQGGG